jgi:hypothetical protein
MALLAAACGGSDAGTGTTENGVGTGSGGAGTSTGGSTNVSSGGAVTGSGGSANVSSGGTSVTSPGGAGGNTSGAPSACAAGSIVQGGGADSCPNLPWRCVDETVSNPPFHLAGAECGPGHTGACCNYNDKCLMVADPTSAQSAVEVASAPCQAGCVVNPSAQACLDCINANLATSSLPALSSGCGTCFVSLITCSTNNCLTQCLAGSSAPGCRECVFNNCTIGAGKFNECTGMLGNAGTKK